MTLLLIINLHAQPNFSPRHFMILILKRVVTFPPSCSGIPVSKQVKTLQLFVVFFDTSTSSNPQATSVILKLYIYNFKITEVA